MPRKERGFFELYRDDPERADALVFGRRSGPSRRGFLKGAGLGAMAAAVGAPIAFPQHMPSGLIPAALAQTPADGEPVPLDMPGKDSGLMVLQDRPLNAETPEHLLDDDITPASKFFIRNNGLIPEPADDPQAWQLTVDGEVDQPLTLTVGELESRFDPVTYRLQMECGGNGRKFFTPPARGNQWGNGAVSCAEWTGVRLRDVLNAAGVKPSAVYTGHYGADPHLSGDPDRVTISRGVPMAKAMEEHTLLVFRMNGEPIPQVHGAPLRVICPGYPGSASSKWLTRIWVRDQVHDGPGMGQTSYRVTKFPIVPGTDVEEEDTVILESMPVRSIITNPAHGTRLPAGTRNLDIRGQAWAGEETVRQVDVSIDYGSSWQPAQLSDPPNKYAWQRWTAAIRFPSQGYYEIWVRATDSEGRMQPHIAGNWNPQGYGANPMHRIAVLIEA